jgi:PhnB protein
MAFKPLMNGYQTVIPYLIVNGAESFLAFLTKAFGATEMMRELHPDGAIRHAQVRIGDSVVMVSDSRPEHPAIPSMIFLYVESADETYEMALTAGATSIRAPQDESHGNHMGGVVDPFGVQWWMANPIG